MTKIPANDLSHDCLPAAAPTMGSIWRREQIPVCSMGQGCGIGVYRVDARLTVAVVTSCVGSVSWGKRGKRVPSYQQNNRALSEQLFGRSPLERRHGGCPNGSAALSAAPNTSSTANAR